MLEAALLLLACLLPTRTQTPAAVDEPSSGNLLARVVLLGASASAGYGLKQELGAEVDLGSLLECALDLPDGAVTVHADSYFFTDPRRFAREYVDATKASHPSLVVALDFLFWFPYGPEPTEEARQHELELGLELLSELDCHLVVADFPDVRQALSGKGPFGAPLVTPDLLPRPETLSLLNERLHSWAVERGRVTVVPLADFLERLRAGEALSLGPNHWPEDSLRLFLQEDLLHPTLEGAIAMTELALDALRSESSWSEPSHIALRAEAVRERMMERTAAERAAKEAADRRREERRKAREERKQGGGGGGGSERPAA